MYFKTSPGTLILSLKMSTEPKACKKIIGYDANALYLWSILQEMPTNILYAEE
jgi:hypothetical protein